MTATIFSDRHTGLGSRIRGGLRLTAVAAALIVAASGVLGGALSAQATPTPTPTPTTAQTIEPVITATVGSVGTLRAGDALRVAVDIDNAGDADLATGIAGVSVGPTMLATPAALQAWLDGSADVALDEVATVTTPAVPSGKRISTAITAAATLPAVIALKPGVYPFRTALQAGGTALETRGVFTVQSATATAAPATIVVPITAPPANRTLIDAKELAALTAPTGALTALLDGVAGTPAVLAVDPAVVASVRVLGSSAPPSATAWLTRLMSLPNERFALQFADADVATQFDAGLTKLLQPATLNAFMKPADFGTHADTPTTPPASAGAPQLPPLDQLTDVQPTLTGLLWPASGTVSGAVLQNTQGVTLLVSSSQSSVGASGRVSSDGRSQLVYDAPTSTTLRAAAAATDPGARDMLVSRMLGEAYFAAAASGGQPSLIVMDRGSAVNTEAMQVAIGAFTSAGHAMSTWQQLLAAPERAGSIALASPSAEHVTAAKTLISDEGRIAAFASVLVQPDLLVGRERARLLQSIASTWIAQSGWTAAFEAQTATTQQILDAVKVVGGSDVNIVGSGVNLPVSVRNDLPFPVAATLLVEPADLRLTVQRSTSVEAAPSSTTRVRVPVTAGVSNGETEVRFSLRSKTGVQIGKTAAINLTVRADWERIGLIVLGCLAVLLLVVGTFRTIRRRRRGTVEPRPSRRAARAAYRAKQQPSESADG